MKKGEEIRWRLTRLSFFSTTSFPHSLALGILTFSETMTLWHMPGGSEELSLMIDVAFRQNTTRFV